MRRESKSVRMAVVTFVVVLAFAFPATAQAWQLWFANPTSYGGYNHWQNAGGTGTKYGVVLQNTTVWSTGEQVNVGGDVWIKVYWNGQWGWSIYTWPGYSPAFVYQGVTATPWSTPTTPANGSSVNDRRSPIRWNYGDPDGGASDAANIQIASDAGFGSLLRNGGTSLGAYNPDWDMAPGQYWWRAQTHSWINGWGGWSGASTFIVRQPTGVAIRSLVPVPSVGTTASVKFAAQKWLDGTFKGNLAGKTVGIWSSPDGKKWTKVAAKKTNSAGYCYYTTPVLWASKVYYKGVIAEDQWNRGASKTIAITTRKSGVTVGRPVAPKKARKGVAITVKGTIKPWHATGTYPVRIKAYYWSTKKKAWVYHSAFKAKAYNTQYYTGYKGRFAPPHGYRYWAFRAYAPADAKHYKSVTTRRSHPYTWVP